MDNLLLCDGRHFSAKIEGVFTVGVITVQDSVVYLCQNTKSGAWCADKKGFKYSWVVLDGDAYGLEMNSVTDFILAPRATGSLISKKDNKWLLSRFSEDSYIFDLISLSIVSIDSIKNSYKLKYMVKETLDFGINENGLLYDKNLFTITAKNELLRTEDTFICRNCGKIHALDYKEKVITGESFVEYCKGCTVYMSRYEGNCYTESGLRYHNLIRLVDNSIVDSSITTYRWDDGGYRLTPEKKYRREYHSKTSDLRRFDELIDTPFYIGYEIEKEDKTVLNSIYVGEFESVCKGWRKERDGSLSDTSGFEIISPILPLSVPHIESMFRDNPVLLRHTNAKYSDHCGGHINISNENKTGTELFDTIKGYLPLLYALFPDRTTINYCEGKKASDLKKDNSKYQAVRILNAYIELRIFSAVVNIDHLIWRTKLVEMMMKHPAATAEKAYLNIDIYFVPLFKQLYKTKFKDKFASMKERFRLYTKQYEGKDIPLAI